MEHENHYKMRRMRLEQKEETILIVKKKGGERERNLQIIRIPKVILCVCIRGIIYIESLACLIVTFLFSFFLWQISSQVVS